MAEKNKENYFEVLNNINVNDKIEKKNGLSYLSWVWAWGEVKKIHPDATYTIYEREGELGPINYFTDGKTCWVKTGVIINGIEHIEELPIMDFKNKSISLENITSFDVNKSIQRSLTKALARHGLGLYIYAGEDLSEDEKENNQNKNNSSKTKTTEVEKKITEDKTTENKIIEETKKHQELEEQLDKVIKEKNVDYDKLCKMYKIEDLDIHKMSIKQLEHAIENIDKFEKVSEK